MKNADKKVREYLDRAKYLLDKHWNCYWPVEKEDVIEIAKMIQREEICQDQ